MSERTESAVVVLVAEDETLVRLVVTEMLQETGFHVHEARDGQEALTILEVRGESVAALVTDITMPNLGGLDLAAIVKTRWPHIGIVIASGQPPTDVRDLMPEGAIFLAKPYQEAGLLNAVRAVVRAERQNEGSPVALHNLPLHHAGQMHGSGGLAQPLSEPDE